MTTPSDVIIVGAGPIGLTLACELHTAGVRPTVIERLPAPTGLSKALSLVGRSVDSLDYRGMLEGFGAHTPTGNPGFAHFGLIPMNLAAVPDLGLRGILVQQAVVEQVLGDCVRDRGIEVRRGCELTALRHDDHGAAVDCTGPDGTVTLEAQFVVGCDGGASRVRKLAGIDFAGTDPTLLIRFGDLVLDPDFLARERGQIRSPLLPLGGDFYRAVVIEPYPPDLDRDTPITLDELQAAVRRANGRDLPVRQVRWLSRFTDAGRQAMRYRSGRVLLAGDAAHIHLPAGGPGLNTGLQDAFNLGWKLAAEIRGWAPPGLLDTYHTERFPEGEQVLLHTRAQSALIGPDIGGRLGALREVVGRMLTHEQTLRDLVGRMYALDTRYDMRVPEQHALTGRFMPDLTLTTPTGPSTIAELMRPARGVLLDFTATGQLAETATDLRDRITTVVARCLQPPAPAVLIRPDGYVAWAGVPDSDAHGLRTALAAWFGEAVIHTATS